MTKLIVYFKSVCYLCSLGYDCRENDFGLKRIYSSKKCKLIGSETNFERIVSCKHWNEIQVRGKHYSRREDVIFKNLTRFKNSGLEITNFILCFNKFSKQQLNVQQSIDKISKLSIF